MLIINKKENKICNIEFISRISVEPIFGTEKYEISCRVDNFGTSIKSFSTKQNAEKELNNIIEAYVNNERVYFIKEENE